MKTTEEFRASVYAKRDAKAAQARKIKKRVLSCMPLAVLIAAGSVFIPLLRQGRFAIAGRSAETAGERNDAASSACMAAADRQGPFTLKAQPGKLLDLSLNALYREAYSEDEELNKEDATESQLQAMKDELEKKQEEMDRQREILIRQREESRIDPDFSEAVNDFARDMSPLVAAEFSENDCWSPLSAYYAFSMTGAGADGETEKEFLELLNAKDMDWLAEQCEKYYRQHYHNNDGSVFTLANSMWIDQRRGFKEDFLETARKSYYASMLEADFADPTINEAISRWVSDHTGGLINPRFEYDEDTELAILNAVYFKAAWIDEFYAENNTEDDFTKADGSKVTAEFMHRGDNQDVYFGQNFTRASLRLQDGAAMVFILPDEGVDPKELLGDPEAFEKMFYPLESGDTDYCQVKWSVPKFSMDSSFNLGEIFSARMPTAFDEVLADFSGISPRADLYIGKVDHGAHIAIDEQGAEAAAYTAIDACGAAAPPDEIVEMNLNRPFLFAIVADDETTGTREPGERESSILFVGACGDPTASAPGAAAAAAN